MILFKMQVVLAANDLPSINDVTYSELIEIISKVTKIRFRKFLVRPCSLLTLSCYLPVKGWRRTSHGCQFFKSFNCQLWQWFTCKEINSILLHSRKILVSIYFLAYIIRSLTCMMFTFFNLVLFNGLQVIDLTRVSQEVAYLANDADLVILEGMVSSS